MRLWGDGFDHYGSDESNMLDGQAYAQADECVLSTAQAATGTHSIQITGETGLFDFEGLRKVLPSAIDKMGAIARFYFPTQPTSNFSNNIFAFLSNDPDRAQLGVVWGANGQLLFYRGPRYNAVGGMDYGTLIAETDPLLTAAAWNHVEVQCYIHDTLGWVRVAINGIHRYQATGLDTKYDSSNIASVGQTHHFNTSGAISFYMDDYRLYDFVGNSAVDTDWCCTVDGSGIATNYIGELQGMLQLADGDTAEADWGFSTGASGYPLIGKATPDDTTYIYSTAAPDLSEFTLTDLPEDITYIRGLDFHSRMSKSDAGTAMYKVGMKSVAATTDVDEIPMTVEPAYWYAQIDVDPNSGVRWTRPSFNAAWLRMTRSV